MDLAPIVIGVLGLPVGSMLNRLVVREPGYVITDPGDLPEGADPALLDELEEVPELERVPVLAIVRPSRWWRRWFPVTEVTTALLFALAVDRIGMHPVLIPILFLVAALVTLAAVDFRVYRIPDRLNFPAMTIGFSLIAVVSMYEGAPELIFGAIAGGFAYAAMLFLAHIVYPRGMGWGDVKLAWLMGFYVGWVGWDAGSLLEQFLFSLRFVLLAAAAGSLLGVLIGGGYAVLRRSTKVVFPYGPSLAIGCLYVVLWSAELR